MRKRIGHILEFLFLFSLNAVALWFFRGYLNLLIAVLMVLFLTYSIISVYIAVRYLSVEIEMPTAYVEKNTAFHAKIRLRNRCVLPFVQARIALRAGNIFLGDDAEDTLVLAVKPKGVTETVYPLYSEYSGNIELRAVRLTLFDLLGVWPVKKPLAVHANIGILPVPDMDTEFPLNDFSVGMEEAEESSMTGSDFSDVSEVREYLPGDPMKNIHWKLSAKKTGSPFDGLMVKERTRMSSRKMMVVLALAKTSPAAVDAAMDQLYGLGICYLRQHMPVTVCYYSERFHEIREEAVDSEEKWRDAVLQIMYSQAGDGAVEAGFSNLHAAQGYVLVSENGVSEKDW